MKDSDIVLTVENVAIRYKIGDFKDIGLKEWVVRHLKRNYNVESFMAVNGVTFKLQKGDMLGIIGCNGSGKSTLLKAVAGIMKPTHGAISANGNISALLELISGFDGNLTVKENAYLRGAMLGYTRNFMDKIYQQILDFSELKEFENRPFKQLSSGMQSRLAFSIASMVDPDILILDEVLSVGDGLFQAKSAEKMREIISRGTTTILVSHSLEQIRSLCNKVLWLHKGVQIAFGDCQRLCDVYQRFLNCGEDKKVLEELSDVRQTESSVNTLGKYDYLIVGAGLYGAVFAHEAMQHGKKCLVIDRRGHIAGNAHDSIVSGINVHMYGPHVFHTSNERVWEYVNRFARFNNFINEPIANYNGEIYNLPFNMNTFNKLFGVISPEEAEACIYKQASDSRITVPENLEEQAIVSVGKTVYEKLIKGYTEKQWGMECTQISPDILKRIIVKFKYDNKYFDDSYQGVPIDGYDSMVKNMLEGAEILLNTDFKDFISENPDISDKIIYSGMIDEYFNYSDGVLEYRSLSFDIEELNKSDFQGNAVVNYTSASVPYTRIIEHKHFANGKQSNTVITREYPQKWEVGMEPYYPINNAKNNELYQRYADKAKLESNVIFGGRLGEYKYYNMDEVILSALEAADRELEK